MNTRNGRFREYTVAAALMVLVTGWSLASAAEEQFALDLGKNGRMIRGTGTGFHDGAWYRYPETGHWVQWFYDGDPSLSDKKVVEVDLTVQALEPGMGVRANVEVAVNWTRASWPKDQNTPPLPNTKDPGPAPQYIRETVIVPRTVVPHATTMNATLEISEFCPQWVSIDIRGENVQVEGRLRHECVPGTGQVPPTGDRDFGDAPEGAVAYPVPGTRGQFPTCVGVDLATWIEHASTGQMYFGRKVDLEPEGNGGACPVFTPDACNHDEGMSDSDAGLLTPRAYTIEGPPGHENIYPLIFTSLESMCNAGYTAIWGVDIDIDVHNNSRADAYVNLLMDWDHDGQWGGAAPYDGTLVAEHALVDFRVPAGYNGPLSELAPPNFQVGPIPGYVWARFTISERPVRLGWTGAGVFTDGETEDYLLHVKNRPPVCSWSPGDSHTMHWAQLPDKQATGLAVDLHGSSLADDFRCAQSGRLAGIHFWGSFQDDVMPQLGVDSLTFEVNIYADLPADGLIPWSRPGALLWTGDIPRFSYDVTEVNNHLEAGWFEPTGGVYEPDDHQRLYQYDICLDPNDTLFVATLGTVYWLEIREIPGSDNSYTFGWQTTKRDLQYHDAAVWYDSMLGWLPLSYPIGHPDEGEPLDLAFVVTGVSWEDTD
jgi:hypothetical protein